MQFGIPISHHASPAALTLYAGNAPREGGNGSVQALLFFFPCHFSWQLPTQSGKQKVFFFWLRPCLRTGERERKKNQISRKNGKEHRIALWIFWPIFQDKNWEPLNHPYILALLLCFFTFPQCEMWTDIDSSLWISWFVRYITWAPSVTKQAPHHLNHPEPLMGEWSLFSQKDTSPSVET